MTAAAPLDEAPVMMAAGDLTPGRRVSEVDAAEPPRLRAIEQTLAPPAMLDKNPIVIGQDLSLSYMAKVYRQSLQGQRQPLADLLSELLEHDPQTVATFGQRVLNVAAARWEIVAPRLADGDPRRDVADVIVADCREQWERLPMRAQTISHLMWGVFSGLSGGENHWTRRSSTYGWALERVSFLHTRRLALPDPRTWDVYVADGGVNLASPTFDGLFRPAAVSDPRSRQAGASGVGGGIFLRCADYPAKFILHAPQLRAEYPTRDGLGRVVGTYMLLKRMVLRNAAQDTERFTKPWAIAYSRSLDGQGRPRGANSADIAAGDSAIRALGVGALSGASLPDSIKIELLKASTELSVKEFTEYLDSAIAKVALGQTFTVQNGKYGSRNMGETGRKSTMSIAKHDAECLAETLERDVFAWMVHLNFPGFEDLTPEVRPIVDDPPDPIAFSEIIQRLAQAGYPIDADATARVMGVQLLPNPTDAPRPLMAPYNGAGAAANGAPPIDPAGDPAGAVATEAGAAPPDHAP